MWSTLINVALFAAVNQVAAQGDLSMANNVTDLEGTWSSNVAVSTGNVSITLHSTSTSARTERRKAVRRRKRCNVHKLEQQAQIGSMR